MNIERKRVGIFCNIFYEVYIILILKFNKNKRFRNLLVKFIYECGCKCFK